MNKTKKERVKKLIAALRSGKYKQTTKALKDETGYCCLGVACDISRVSKWVEGEINGVGNNLFYDGEDALLPPKVQNYYGFLSQDGSFSGGALTLLNDKGKTFKEIAKIIERCLNCPETEMFENDK